MVTFTNGVFASLSTTGAYLGSYVNKNAPRGFIKGLLSSIITVAIDRLFGRKIGALALACVVVYGVSRLLNRTTESPMIPLPRRSLKETLCAMTQDNLRLIAQKFYTVCKNNAEVRCALRSGDELCQVSECFEAQASVTIERCYKQMDVTVVNEDFLDAATKEAGYGKVAVISFGSPIEAGGGFEEGTKGQEEDLCYRSDLAGFMHDQVYNKFGTNKQLYPLHNRVLHTPDVTVFRASYAKSHALLTEPFRVGVLTVPSPVKPTLTGIGTEFVDYASDEDKQKIRNLIITQLYVAYLKNYDRVILGAFGCGAFKNPPQAVAKIYKDVIQEFFQGAFKKIVFAILDDHASQDLHNPTGNFQPFQKCFQTS